MFGLGKKKDVFDVIFGNGAEYARRDFAPAEPTTEPSAPVAVSGDQSYRYAWDDGSKFPGGYGPTELLITDYWTLRQRSIALFETNIYARGLLRRLITNEINIGLHLQCTPEEEILGFGEDDLADWSETVENRFGLWARTPKLCDQAEQQTFGQMQATARLEAMIAGDALVVLRQDNRTGLPRLQLVSGDRVQTAYGEDSKNGNEICDGVEIDPSGRHVAFWVQQDDGTSKRLPAWGEKSGRRLAWLIYGTEKRLDGIRGKPLLSLILQSLKEIDRYRDSTQRKAAILAQIAIWIKKSQDKPSTLPITAGARRVSSMTPGAATTQDRRQVEIRPGTILEELQYGEEPQAFQANGNVEAFGVFEEAIIQAIAWHYEIPPEILTLSFSSNYSASQAALNEFKMYLTRVRAWFGTDFCQPAYEQWLIAEVLAKKIEARGLVDAWRDPAQYDTLAAWFSADWTGHVKPSVDRMKLVNAYAAEVDQGFITRDRAARELNGSKFSKNVQKIARENAALAEAKKPLVELEQKPAPAAPLSPAEDPSSDPADDDEEDPEESAERLPN